MNHTVTTHQHKRFHQLSWVAISLLILLSFAFFAHLYERLAIPVQSTTHATVAGDRLVGPVTEPALLLLNADALVTTLHGGTVTLTARVRDTDGRPVPGIPVSFQSAQGSVAPASAETDASGVATATFTAGAVEGQALVMATVNDLVREAAVQVVKPNSATATHALQLELGGTKLDPGQQMNLTAVLRDGTGAPLAGEVISLFGSLGEVTPASAVSDANGRTSFTYHAGANAGQAMITALAGYASHSATFSVGIVASPEQKLFLPLVTR